MPRTPTNTDYYSPAAKAARDAIRVDTTQDAINALDADIMQLDSTRRMLAGRGCSKRLAKDLTNLYIEWSVQRDGMVARLANINKP